MSADTPNHLIALARQAKATTYTNRHYPDRTFTTFSPESLQAFADLIRKDAFRDGYEKGIAGFMEAVKLEREQCAVLCDAEAATYGPCEHQSAWLAAAIRARTTT